MKRLAVAVALAVSCGAEPLPEREATRPQAPPARAVRQPSASTTASPPPEAPSPGPPAVRLVGRFDTREPAGPRCAWPGCRIVASFRGTAVTVRLDEDASGAGPDEWDVALDGAWGSKIVLEGGARDYDLAIGLPDREHTVELFKRTESGSGVTRFVSFDFHGGALLPPPPARARLLEVVGDADASGRGYEGAGLPGNCGGQGTLGRYQSFREGWAARLAAKLSADLLGTVSSGKGFYWNLWRPDPETMDRVYPRTIPSDPTSVFDLTTLAPHVVVVAIGGNDFLVGEPNDTGPAPLEGFTEKVRAFTAMLRASYPEAHVFLMAHGGLSDAYPPGRARRTNVVAAYETVVAERARAGDARVHLLAPPEATDGELTACEGHGGPTYHERIASFAAAQIAVRAAW